MHRPPVLGTISWSDIGVQRCGRSHRQQMLVSTDGSHWDSASGPERRAGCSDLVATDDGFLLLAQSRRSSGTDIRSRRVDDAVALDRRPLVVAGRNSGRPGRAGDRG